MFDNPVASRVDYSRLQGTARRMILRFGRPATLVNNQTGATRPCHVTLVSWSAYELNGGLYDPLSRKALFSGSELPAPPDHERERLLIYVPLSDPPVVLETLRLDKRAVPVNPGGTVIYWWCPVFNIT